MATASKQSGRATQMSRRAPKLPEEAPIEFVISESNSGDYRWEVAGGGSPLARSGSFASYEEAAQATQQFRDSVGSALFDCRLPSAPS